jgi:hypothetical protein
VLAQFPKRTLKPRGRETGHIQSKGSKVTSTLLDAAQDIVSPELFQRITDELTEAMNVMGPLASVIVREHVASLGESMKTFPKTRLPELLESLSKEILDEKRKIDFRERIFVKLNVRY